MYRIGEFSKMSKISIKTLRYYDEVDLLKPKHIDPETSYRLYTTDQLMTVHTIQCYRQMGISIKEIKLLLLGKDEQKTLTARREELLREKQELLDQISRIDFVISGAVHEQYMNYRAVIKETPEGIVYAKKMVLKNYMDYFDVIPKLGEEVAALNPEMLCAVPEYCYVEYLDGEYREENRAIEFCEMVDRYGKAPEGVEFRFQNSVTVVSVMHRGSYADIGMAYAYAARWIDENGYIISGNPRESQIDGIWNCEKEEDWLTEIQIPVMKR